MRRRSNVLGIVLLAASVYIVMPLSDAIVIGAVTAYGLRVLVRRMSRFMDREVAEFSLLSGLFLAVTTGVYLVVSNVSTVVVEVIRLSQLLITNVNAVLAPYDLPMVSQYISQSISALSGYMRQALFSVAASLPWVVLQLVTYFLVVYYLYREGDRINERVVAIIERLPKEEAEMLLDVKKSMTNLIRNVFVVYGTMAIIMGFIGGAGYYLIGQFVMGHPIPFYWVWGLLIGLAAFLEGIGSFIFTGPLMVFYFVQNQPWMVFWLVVFQMTFLGVLPAMLLPYIGSTQLDESFFVMILGLVAGPIVFGVKGLVLGPLFIITLKDLVVARYES
ncbi:MAG: AI-2E family transporter [Candidatus Nanohaloarchaea archaeon]|nr:AI-2E family transporter [Candidatus Nanohaloarchaea archaeon]